MKSLIWGFLLLVTVVSVSAAYIPDPGVNFEYKGGSCSENGSMTFNLTHEGNQIFFKDINFTIESDDFSPLTLKGIWLYPDNYFINSTFIENDFYGKSRLKFRTTNNIFTKGNYIVTINWVSNSAYQNKFMFAIDCPGIKCNNNDDCISQQKCTNKTCEWVKCSNSEFAIGHKCFPVCNDYDSCTQDYMIDGKCVYIKIEGCPVVHKVIDTNIFARIWNWLKGIHI